MRRALQLARCGRYDTSPNPMVGAVIVHDGVIIGEGNHRQFGHGHAEVNAVASVQRPELLPESTIYVTLEPCSHYGKTPPCAKMLVEKRFRRVVVGCLDPNPRVAGRGVTMLREAGIDVSIGVLEQDCLALNHKFITAQTLQRPYVLLKWAMNPQGYMAADVDGHPHAVRFSTSVTSMMVHRLRAQFDAIMVGSGTLLADNPRLDVRSYAGRSPRPVVVDRRRRAPMDSNLFSRKETILLTDPDATPADYLATLFARGITSVMVEGGPTLLRAFIDADLWDEARIEIAPIAIPNPYGSPMPIPQGSTSTTILDGHTIITITR